jgi:hypothetical protein
MAATPLGSNHLTANDFVITPTGSRAPEPAGISTVLSQRQEWRNAMADDKSKRDNRDRSKVAGSEDYEVRYLAEKTGISSAEARDLVDRFGNDRELLLHQAQQLSKSS